MSISLSSYVFCRAAAIGDGDYDFDEKGGQ